MKLQTEERDQKLGDQTLLRFPVALIFPENPRLHDFTTYSIQFLSFSRRLHNVKFSLEIFI